MTLFTHSIWCYNTQGDPTLGSIVDQEMPKGADLESQPIHNHHACVGTQGKGSLHMVTLFILQPGPLA